MDTAWTDHDLVFARDGFKLYRGEVRGPKDPKKVSARWRTLRTRLHLPENFRIHRARKLAASGAGRLGLSSPV
ncbi:hypothetical protein ABZY31_25665 [Streptomyces sp. NPDC006529]|uniref:hypothetical protein n=1 Tax=Streptomyces sp. NPDC006529 TaxID=3157177 RepID=UPI0033AC8746